MTSQALAVTAQQSVEQLLDIVDFSLLSAADGMARQRPIRLLRPAQDLVVLEQWPARLPGVRILAVDAHGRPVGSGHPPRGKYPRPHQ
jgi:hypothetical protein